MGQRNLNLTMEEEPHWSQLWDENWEMAMSITGHSSKTCSSKGKKLVEHLGETERVGNKQDPEKKNLWKSFELGPASPPPLRQRGTVTEV